MKPYYSIDELSKILQAPFYDVASGLIASGSTLIYNGKPADIAQWKSFIPLSLDGIDKFTLNILKDPFPDPARVMVDGEILSQSWKDCICQVESPPASDDAKPAKEIATSERTSLLTIIAALCDYSAIDYKERGAATKIKELTEEIGVPVSDDTIHRALKKIPDALVSRMK